MTQSGNRQESDEELVAQTKKGGLTAFENLVGRHQKKMLNIAFRMCGNYEDACEIVQDAFLAAYKGIGRFEERSGFSTWLYTITLNQTRNHMKKASTLSARREHSLNEPLLSEDGFIQADMVSNKPSALEVLEKRDLREIIQQCVSGLDDEFREVLVLRDIQGFAYAEIAAMLRIAEGTVKSRLFRARDSVKNCLKKLLDRI
ncbi:MAG: RNA polymerase sigma factor [Actinomycetota bacterium]|nr:RNA polymerase sigma factor [Actinomycetota bacterium]